MTHPTVELDKKSGPGTKIWKSKWPKRNVCSLYSESEHITSRWDFCNFLMSQHISRSCPAYHDPPSIYYMYDMVWSVDLKSAPVVSVFKWITATTQICPCYCGVAVTVKLWHIFIINSVSHHSLKCSPYMPLTNPSYALVLWTFQKIIHRYVL